LRAEAGDDPAEGVDQLVEGVEQVPVPRLGCGGAHGCRSPGARNKTPARATHTSAPPGQTPPPGPDTPQRGMKGPPRPARTPVPTHWNVSSSPGCRIATMAK